MFDIPTFWLGSGTSTATTSTFYVDSSRTSTDSSSTGTYYYSNPIIVPSQKEKEDWMLNKKVHDIFKELLA